jgi:hypothetical protein
MAFVFMGVKYRKSGGLIQLDSDSRAFDPGRAGVFNPAKVYSPS